MNSTHQLLHRWLTAVFVIAAAVFTGQAAEAPKTFAEIAVPVKRPPGFPHPSAVCFSSRWKHPSNPKDPHDTFQTAADFHVTGFYWINGPDQEWFREIKRRGYTVQGWLSTILPDKLFGNTRQQGRIMNEKGELVAAPWMRAWNGVWGCFNSPEYRAVYLAYVKMYLDAGVDSLHMDDPGENFTAARWGGCYCPHCKAKAARLGKSPPDIQRESTEEFYRYIRAEMNAHAKRHVPFSCNSHPGDPCFFESIFDFGLEELDHTTPVSFRRAMKDAERRGKAQMYTFRSTSVPETRRAIAVAYACGSHILVPWDVYMPGPNAPRYFGRPEEYADLYGFARACAPYLDGYEDAAFVSPEATDERYPVAPLSVTGGSANLNLFVRAKPGQADAPLVIHCLDLDDSPQPFRLHLDPTRLFGQRGLTVELLVPPAYDRALHQRAEQNKDYVALAVRTRLAEGCVTACDVPAMRPWGLMVITPAATKPKQVWPPSAIADPASLFAETLSVRLQSATPGAVVRYTIDGTPPTASSPAYAQPLALTRDTTIQARAFARNEASAVTSVSFRRTSPPHTARVPDTMPGLRLWLAADSLLTTHQPGAPIARWTAKVGPAMEPPKTKLHDGRMPTPPVLAANVLNGLPVVRFTNDTALLVIRDFANQHLGKAFTVFLVTRSEDSLFGACGNALNGNGGLPRLYLMRENLTYNATSLPLKTTVGAPELHTYVHDGVRTVFGSVNQRTSTDNGPGFAATGQFGGGNFAIPFWCGNQPHFGDVAEVVVFDRRVGEDERAGIEQYLTQKYALRTVKLWQ